MDELTAGVAEYIDEELAKEDGRELEPNASEEATSPPRVALTNVAEVSTPPGATGEIPLLLKLTNQWKRLCLLISHLLNYILYCGFHFGTLYVHFSSFLLLLGN